MSPRRPHPARFPVVLPALLLAACTSTGNADAPKAPDAARPRATRGAADDMQFTETFEVRFGTEHVGYVVDVLPVPDGVVDQRAYRPGTKLIQGLSFEFLGFISPHGTTYRFDPTGDAHTVGVGSVEQGIAAFFGKNGPPTLVSTSPGVRPAGAAPSGASGG